MFRLSVHTFLASYVSPGSDNISIVLSLAFYFLLSQPMYYQTLQAELDQAFPDRMGHLDATKLTSLTFLNAVINETLRLGSPFFLPRVIPQGGVTIDGKFIPQGTIAALASYSQQVSPDNFFPDPLVSGHILAATSRHLADYFGFRTSAQKGGAPAALGPAPK
jgi:cytochrome P450